MLTRTITGAVLFCVLIPCTLFGNYAYFFLLLFLSVVAIHEILTVPGKKRYNYVTKGIVYLCVLSFIFWTFIKSYLKNGSFFNDGNFFLSDIFISILGISVYALLLFLVAIINSKMTLADVTYLFTLGVVVALGFQGMFFCRYFPNSFGLTSANFSSGETLSPDSVLVTSYGEVTFGNYLSKYYEYYNLSQMLSSSLLMFFIFIGTWAGDVGAYLVGMLFGKHRMNPRISPHKTWEGFYGGIVFSLAFSLGFAALFEYAFNCPLVPGLIQFGYSEVLAARGVFSGYGWPFLVFLALAMPIIGNVGGFLFSLVKRNYGVKDYGKIFPGHGGVIDRFDSILINSIMTAAIVLLTANGWGFTV